MDSIVLSSTVARNTEVVAADLDDGLVMMSIEQGKYFDVSGIGPRIWELLAQPITVAAIANTIQAEYEVDEPTCQADMLAFVSELLHLKLVSLHPDAKVPAPGESGGLDGAASC